MPEKDRLEVKHLSPDGRYIGGVSNTEVKINTKLKFTVPDNNNLEHLIQGVIVGVNKTKEGFYSHLVLLDPPAPERVRDFHTFAKIQDCDIGSITKEGMKLYTNCVFFVGLPFDITIDSKFGKDSIDLTGMVLSEETKNIPPHHKYLFKVKFDKELTEQEYKKLKKLDIDN